MPQQPLLAANANIVPAGAKSIKNISAPTLIKATPGTILGIAVVTAPGGTQTVGTINDVTTVAGAAVANQVGVIPAAVGEYSLNNGIPCNNGIVVAPPTGTVAPTTGTVAVWYI